MSINEAKKQLADAIVKYEHLRTELNDKNNVGSYSEQDWHIHLRNLGLETAQLIQTSRTYDDDRLIRLLNEKQNKLKRHAIWKRQHKKRVQQKKRQQIKKNEKWVKDIGWKVTISPSVNAAAATAAAAAASSSFNEHHRHIQQQAKDKKLVKFLSKKLALLTEIRALRRKKLSSKGHFFADEGNAFFNKIKEWHQANDSLQSDQVHQTQQQQQPVVEKQLVIHPQDTWHTMAIDKTAYNYWCGSDQSLDTLLNTRRLWDQYILLESKGNDALHKVPPTCVAPTPPANAIWASYLL